jgi:hypothetical protein
MHAASAGRTIATPVDEAAVRLDLDLKDSGVVVAGKGSEGLAAALTTALRIGQGADCFGGR